MQQSLGKVVLILCFLCAHKGAFADGKASLSKATTWYSVTKTTGLYTGTSFSSSIYFLHGDTVIHDTTYRALYCDSIFCGGLRQTADGQKVYIRPTQELMHDPFWEPGEHLLYNFDVQVGDTVFAFDGSYHGIDDMGEDLSVQYRWIVDDVQTIDGRKHVSVRGGQLHTHQVEWIEGVGTRFGLFENVYEDALWRTFSSYALCAADNEGNILYSFDTDDIGVHNNNCQGEPMDIENISTDNPSATKHLHNGQILILRGDNIYTITGQKVK